jgi:hypothetical protein
VDSENTLSPSTPKVYGHAMVLPLLAVWSAA